MLLIAERPHRLFTQLAYRPTYATIIRVRQMRERERERERPRLSQSVSMLYAEDSFAIIFAENSHGSRKKPGENNAPVINTLRLFVMQLVPRYKRPSCNVNCPRQACTRASFADYIPPCATLNYDQVLEKQKEREGGRERRERREERNPCPNHFRKIDRRRY